MAVDGTLLAEGREAEVYLLADGNVLKLWRRPEWADRREREAAALRALADGGVVGAQVVDGVVVDGRPGLVTTRVEGEDHITFLSRRPLAVFRAGTCLGAMHRVVAPDRIPEIHDVLRARIEEAEPLPDEFRGPVLELLGALPRGDRLCHGDLHPGNVMGGFDAPVAIDWGDASRGDPMADVARTDVLLTFGTPPTAAGRFIRTMARLGGGLIRSRYHAAYRKHAEVDDAALARWRTVRVAARLGEDITEEHPRLLRHLRETLDR